LRERAIRYTTCRLFICRGLDKKLFKRKFNQSFDELINKTGFKWFLKTLKLTGDLREENEKIVLTRKGLLTAHKITWAFVMNVPCRMVEECLRKPLPERISIP